MATQKTTKISPTTPILIGSAWPYANGSLHLGHVSALLPADVLARFYRLRGNPVLFVSGSDAHGAPIALAAEKMGQTPKEVATHFHKEFQETFKAYGFSYDNYSWTEDPKHYKVAQEFFTDLHKKGHLYERTETLPYCEKCKRYLIDRYIEGTCPICGFSPARGDQCDNCGNILTPEQLIDPHCVICGTTPVWKETDHFFLKLSAFQKPLQTWVKSQTQWRPNAKAFSLAMLKNLRDRAVTRDMEWGIPIPLEGKQYATKRIYVWFEAVCGYFSASQKFASWKKFWKLPGKSYHYYVHGKDNIPFHSIIWPMMLMGRGGLHLPDQILASECLTLEGQQFSTSRNWAVWAKDAVTQVPADALRYFLIAHGPERKDADFSWAAFQEVTNKELIGTLTNYLNRLLTFTDKNFNRKLSSKKFVWAKEPLLKDLDKVYEQVGEHIIQGEFRKAVTEILNLAQKGNIYLDKQAPWTAIKEDTATAQHAVLVATILAGNLAILLSPFVPEVSADTLGTLGIKADGWKAWKPKEIKLKRSPRIVIYRIADAELPRMNAQG